MVMNLTRTNQTELLISMLLIFFVDMRGSLLEKYIYTTSGKKIQQKTLFYMKIGALFSD